MSEEIMDILPVNGNNVFEDGDLILFEKEGTLTFVDDAAVDSSTTFEGIASTLMKTGKGYRLAYCKVMMTQSHDFADGTSPTTGTRRVDVGINLPGKTDHPSASKQKHPVFVQLLAANVITFAGAPGNGDKWIGKFGLSDDFKNTLYDSGNDLSVQIHSAASTGAGADSADDAGGIFVKITGMLIARGSKAYDRIFPRG
jgi:hypothetical protein